MNLSTFTENTSNPSLARAVVKQYGRWVDWKESASDIASYGADGGVNGFIYHVDTIEFYEANKGNIHELARQMMDDLGGPDLLCEFVASFNCVDLEAYEVEQAIEDGESNEDYTQVANALAWYALEETANDYINQLER
tara:strand:+ start:1826 stop:2239 length:414 start_codon:yes stop_codon:yes gene_type:complete